MTGRSQQYSTVKRTLLFATYFILPSLVWSLVYRQPKIVADVLPLAILEGFLPALLARLLRLGWCLLCVTMLLLEWNIFPESYLFYLGLMVRAAGFPQGRSVLIGFMLLAIFVALPPPRRSGNGAIVMAMVVYMLLFSAKLWGPGKPYLLGLRQPAPRALQVAWTDLARIPKSSISSGDYNARTPGYVQLSHWLDGKARRPEKILIIVLESWGKTPTDLALLSADIQRTVGTASFKTGYATFSGPTLAGEVRELCGRTLSFRSIDASLADCLPRRARRYGYVTTAYHGYEGYFYNRQILYPQLGFARAWFQTDFGSAARCGGAFDGVCDDVVLDRAVAQLREPGRQLVYIMSLSAHEPVSPAMAGRAYLRASAPPLDGRRVNEALVRRAVDDAAIIARNHDVVLYLVGDHNPPGREESLGLPAGKVPYILIRWHG